MIEMVPKPHIRKRPCGDYLAVAPKRARFHIGVTADTEAAVEHKFWNTYVRWCETLPLKAPHNKDLESAAALALDTFHEAAKSPTNWDEYDRALDALVAAMRALRNVRS